MLKAKLNDFIDARNKEIEASADGKTVVDIGFAFFELFCSSIVHISFGEDVSKMEVEIDVHRDN